MKLDYYYDIWTAMRKYAVGGAMTDADWHAIGWLTMLNRNFIEFAPGLIAYAQDEAERADNERFYRSLMLDKLGESFDFWKFKSSRKGQYLTVRVLLPESEKGRHRIHQLYLDFYKRVGEDMPALIQRALKDGTDPAYVAERRTKREAQIDYWQAKNAEEALEQPVDQPV